MKCKVVSPVTGEIVRTSSIREFRDSGQQFSVKENLLAGELPKYEKMVKKYAAEDETRKEEKPTGSQEPSGRAEKVLEKVVEKEKEKETTQPIIEEKPEPVVSKKKVVKKRKPKIEEKKEVVEEVNFGFF